MQRENYDLDVLRESVPMNISLLNQQQKYVFDTLTEIVNVELEAGMEENYF